ncbi:hypothetical protein GCM10020000_15810 [Streptomyces olivoverticillatus]
MSGVLRSTVTHAVPKARSEATGGDAEGGHHEAEGEGEQRGVDGELDGTEQALGVEGEVVDEDVHRGQLP